MFEVNYDVIVERFASSLYTFALADAEENAYEQGIIDHGFGGASTGFPAPPKLLEEAQKLLEEELGKDAVIADCKAFMEQTGLDEETYGWYLQAQSMGHGVGLSDYGYNSPLTKKHITECCNGFIDEDEGGDPDDEPTYTFTIECVNYQEPYEP